MLLLTTNLVLVHREALIGLLKAARRNLVCRIVFFSRS